MKRVLVLASLLVLLCSADRENVDITADVAAHEMEMEKHFAFVDSERAAEEELFAKLIENDFESRYAAMLADLNLLKQDEKISQQEYQRRKAELAIIKTYIEEYKVAVTKVRSRYSRIFVKPRNINIDGRVVRQILYELVRKIPKIGG